MTQSSSYRPAAGGSSAVHTTGYAPQPDPAAPGSISAGPGSISAAPGSISAASDPISAGPDPISAEPLDIVGLLAGAHHPGAGAVVLFSGEVRNSNKGL